ncbi:MAG: type II toxin-antitoxin system Phd/YefM family antitoxin [Planctomycetota bacterium]
MIHLNASRFKEQCLRLLDEVGPDGILITKHGKPVAKLMPVATDWGRLIGTLKDKVHIRGNVFTTGLAWDAEPGHSHRPARAARRALRKGTAAPRP